MKNVENNNGNMHAVEFYDDTKPILEYGNLFRPINS